MDVRFRGSSYSPAGPPDAAVAGASTACMPPSMRRCTAVHAGVGAGQQRTGPREPTDVNSGSPGGPANLPAGSPCEQRAGAARRRVARHVILMRAVAPGINRTVLATTEPGAPHRNTSFSSKQRPSELPGLGRSCGKRPAARARCTTPTQRQHSVNRGRLGSRPEESKRFSSASMHPWYPSSRATSSAVEPSSEAMLGSAPSARRAST